MSKIKYCSGEALYGPCRVVIVRGSDSIGRKGIIDDRDSFQKMGLWVRMDKDDTVSGHHFQFVETENLKVVTSLQQRNN